MTTINGVPAHVLLVHAVVVLVPITAVLVLLVALWPAARHRLAVLTGVSATITLISVPLTTDAGEWLEHHLPSTPLLREHTELGDYMLPWAIALFVVATLFAVREMLATRHAARPDGPGAAPARAPGGVLGHHAVSVLLVVLAVVAAAGASVTVYKIGDSGAQAAWTGKFSPTPLHRELVRPDGD